MQAMTIDIGDIAELTTQVAGHGSIRIDGFGDDLFEFMVGLAILIYELVLP